MGTLKDYIEKFEQELELTDKLPMETDRCWLLDLDETRMIRITDLSPGFYLYCPLTDRPKGDCEELFARLMGANLFGAATDGGVIGMDAGGGMLSFSRAVPADEGYDHFKNTLMDFINMVDFWTNEVKEFAESK